MENAMKEYILVKDYVKNKAVALVRSEYGRATVIAGDKSAEKVFVDGDPHNLNRNYGFTLLGHSSCHPDIGLLHRHARAGVGQGREVEAS